MVQGTALSAVCAFVVEEAHLTVNLLTAYSPNGLHASLRN
jgi:hypothetical protein